MPVVGQNIPHDSARAHVTGQSLFIDDLAPLRGEVFVEPVGAPVAHGLLRGLDISAALAAPGVVAILTAADIPGHNRFGSIVKDDRLLVEVGGMIEHLGEPVALIVAESREAMPAARKLVRVEAEPRSPVFTIERAIELGQYFGPQRTIARGDARAALARAPRTLEGTLHIGGQDHFYLESQSALAVPGEHGQLLVHSSTQHPSEVQQVVAEVCGLSFNLVTVVCKRMGGGFGGKETQAAQPAAMAALAASRLGRPARVVYGRDDDMRITGKRHPFRCDYTVGFDDDGKILALVVDHWSNGGCSTDLSPSVLERAMLHTDNAYWLPDVEINGRVCKTNLPSNTAFRGFGGPQGVAAIENIIEAIADELGLDALHVRRRNLYGIDNRNVTPYGQVVGNNVLEALLDQLAVRCGYPDRRREIDAFNERSPTHVRGMSLTPVKFGIAFTKKTLNQANALVNLYTDGTVLVSTGATEMGQGVNTRIAQIVADELGIDLNDVVVAPTSTDKNCNTSPTAASSGTDLNGAAAADACGRLRRRLADFCARHVFHRPQEGLSGSAEQVRFEDGFVFDERVPLSRLSFGHVVQRAYAERVNLGERGFYATPGVDFNRETGRGSPFLYFTNGAACSEVLIDRLTGELRVTRVDLLMDVGIPLNPGIDRGQITGGFIQGMGWVTNEELKYAENGELLSHSPTTYKIPNIGDVPPVFNIEFLENPHCGVSLRRMKTVGEPPLLLGLSVWTAARNALSSLSGDQSPRLNIPATGEQLLMLMTEFEQRAAVPVGAEPTAERVRAGDPRGA